MMKRWLPLIILVLLTSSCSIYHVSSTNTSDELYPTNETREVVYLEHADQPHKTIAIVTVNSERNQRISDVLQKMKREAAILGGDAITDLKSDATGPWRRLPAQERIGNAYVRANFTASVIVFDQSN